MLGPHFLLGLCLWAVLAAAAWAAPPIRALIVTGQNGHIWKETTPILWKLLEDTGLFTVDVATSPPKGEDMSGFQPDFAAYAVVISNYVGDMWPEPTQQALVDYVRNGGGLVIYHSACTAFPQWKEYNEMQGLGGWGRRPAAAGPYVRWRDGKDVHEDIPGPAGKEVPSLVFKIDVREPEHPIMKGLPSVFAHGPDELYGFLRGPAKNLTVLATAFAPKELGGSGEHEPLLFTVQYGKGRVFQNTLGHMPQEMKSVAFIATFQRGVEWAATGKVTQKVPDDFPGPDKPTLRE